MTRRFVLETTREELEAAEEESGGEAEEGEEGQQADFDFSVVINL
jgi:hypothetical protein